ncbi:hypothetical protein A2962_02200 [Candidatus Woesebacteria bacterium RIFCSPLOWO2_01_FULL_39_61]|uniref:HMA domain-containing protein n=1 Tax=Candidatus Woesebacteria bacterium RIFCSPHIGHO2_02_FULL_39_13 TaxID=1802505 RepID=A0A1F7Z2U9_9BACT|nr:MAG: hypothetical protein A2692_01215 [Candidatus Woesebacteria bacterium RIFCSPHIGHO2_01_FULL_39_95]OGM33973.1 MAG: hypothetical protein A3D01_03505 [Candidatus Woesebacteria bacterium RIFCSPHIGHO2_02_FULL_39_13]OGM38231.1 MAG: hypothetical protein A3E13_05615 [Candidatus Woesebacteria bacterium RIFCSPHIGHO2_12_FULL_40_20]OGM66937.1 MAG: hypothetical protein A2962_02200 [Candidatus Woesebacteria bacterium RIFCSPLOWO2_01_FULL_39_61]OGM72307.1 MAG: hypothetical protein A3H19_03350 [Candidatus
MTKKTYKVKGMDCDACAKMIELDLEDQNIKASCNYAKELLEVELTDDKDEEKVKNIVKNGGYELA